MLATIQPPSKPQRHRQQTVPTTTTTKLIAAAHLEHRLILSITVQVRNCSPLFPTFPQQQQQQQQRLVRPPSQQQQRHQHQHQEQRQRTYNTRNTMTKASSSSRPATPGIQNNRASLNEYDTPAEATTATAAAAAAATTTEVQTLPPSTEDSQDENECVLCCYPLPIKKDESSYYSCCGQVICIGCTLAQNRTLIIGTNVKKPVQGSKEEELEFMRILASKLNHVCPFCRAEASINNKEALKRLWDRIDDYKDPKAMRMLGSYYTNGDHGLTKNPKKAEELYQQAYDLGDDIAAYNLSLKTSDEARRMKYLEEGVKRGNTHCNNYLGFLAAKSGKHEEAKRQFISAARSGHKKAMSNLMLIYQTPGSVVSKDDLATTLRTHKAAHDKGKSEPREYAIRFKAFKEKMITTGKMKVVGNITYYPPSHPRSEY